MVIRPVTDLRNHFPDVEKDLKKMGEIYLTKNGYGTAVMLSIAEYVKLKGSVDHPVLKQQAPKGSARGVFKEYANPDLIPLEKKAGRIHVLKKWKKYVPEASEDE